MWKKLIALLARGQSPIAVGNSMGIGTRLVSVGRSAFAPRGGEAKTDACRALRRGTRVLRNL